MFEALLDSMNWILWPWGYSLGIVLIANLEIPAIAAKQALAEKFGKPQGPGCLLRHPEGDRGLA